MHITSRRFWAETFFCVVIVVVAIDAGRSIPASIDKDITATSCVEPRCRPRPYHDHELDDR